MDDGLNASELRKRYHKGGTTSDSDLSAAQLRARYGVNSNARGAFAAGGWSAWLWGPVSAYLTACELNGAVNVAAERVAECAMPVYRLQVCQCMPFSCAMRAPPSVRWAALLLKAATHVPHTPQQTFQRRIMHLPQCP